MLMGALSGRRPSIDGRQSGNIQCALIACAEPEKEETASVSPQAVFLCAPGRAHSLGGESPLHARQGEVLARGKGVAGDCESEGSPRQSAGLTNRKRIRGDALGQSSKEG